MRARVTRLSGRFALAVVVMIMCWGCAVAIGAIIPGVTSERSQEQAASVSIGLVQGAIHTDFLLPLDDRTRNDFAALNLPEDAEWLLVGWGAREFYTTVGDYGDVGVSALWSALTGDRAVMRFEAVGSYTPAMTIDLYSEEYDRLRRVILADTDFMQPIGTDLLRVGDKYFAAKGNFNAISTCNQWIAYSLSRAGRSFGAWTQTTWAVRLSWWIYG